MPPQRLTVLVNNTPVTLWQGAHVKDALIGAGGGRRLVRKVEAGTHVVVDENVGAEVELGGALYAGQRLRVEAHR
ncbi:MAG: hypothetical protein QME77_05865 [bacterium]|nr:hypothetical protein [bacterium]